MKKTSFRTVWISDIHLGTRGCQAELLNDFLSNTKCEHLYLVGDIIDGWRMHKGKTYFPQSHVNTIRHFLSKSRKGTQVYYIVGNHDEFLRKYSDFFTNEDFGNIRFADEFIHETADGRKIWVIHGDLYDVVTRYHKWIALLGDTMYSFLIWLNGKYNYLRRKYGYGYWSLSAYLKNKVKQAVEFICSFEEAVVSETKKRKLDGVVVGHIHSPEIKEFGDITYYNDGDWVESCTALVEHHDGTMEIIKWYQNDTKENINNN